MCVKPAFACVKTNMITCKSKSLSDIACERVKFIQNRLRLADYLI